MLLQRRRFVFEADRPEKAQCPHPVHEVATQRDLEDFLDLPRALYRDDPRWAPPLDIETKHFFDGRNPFWKHADARLFLYRDRGRVLGRVAAIADQHYIAETGEPVGYFGYFECVEEAEVAGVLLGAVDAWLRARGVERVRGPINGRLENGCGFQVDGFDDHPFMMMPYNPPYYVQLLEALGFVKSRDLVAYLVDLTVPIPSQVADAAERCGAAGFTVRPLNARRWDEERSWTLDLFAGAFREHWGNVSPPKEDLTWGFDELRWLVDPALWLVAEHEGRPVGLRWMSGDYAPIYRRLRGRLGLRGAAILAWGHRHVHRGKSVLMAIDEDLCGRGIGTFLNYHAVREMQRRNYTSLEYSWIDEHNWPSRRASEKLGGRLYKKYRIFERRIRHERGGACA